MVIKWTKTALAPVDEIAGFIAKDNPTRATSFLLELQSAVTKLQAHPSMGWAARVPGMRELVLHKNYIAIYRVRGDGVEILSCITQPEIYDEPGQPSHTEILLS